MNVDAAVDLNDWPQCAEREARSVGHGARIVSVGMTRMALPLSEPFLGKRGVDATAHLDDATSNGCEEVFDGVRMPVVIEDCGRDSQGDLDQGRVGRSTKRLRPLPVACADGFEERLLDRVLGDERVGS